MNLALSYDHRVIDGATAVQVLVKVNMTVAAPSPEAKDLRLPVRKPRERG